ncbi:hypothetical protein GXM_08463 [Nostoc sphaeroides CCNUC1]|uniref:Uncharacterized protein n=1 Tax=Nostoc sphaeroides CCNUC1 TaxID=2653204 RepID=A0A5P8WGM4_9NOSO|nr:hypothetical protein GXM_08463 [Nostoc sphaeroides CCNUC1]
MLNAPSLNPIAGTVAVILLGGTAHLLQFVKILDCAFIPQIQI